MARKSRCETMRVVIHGNNAGGNADGVGDVAIQAAQHAMIRLIARAMIEDTRKYAGEVKSRCGTADAK